MARDGLAVHKDAAALQVLLEARATHVLERHYELRQEKRFFLYRDHNVLKDAAKVMVFVQTEAKIAAEPKKSCNFASNVHV